MVVALQRGPVERDENAPAIHGGYGAGLAERAGTLVVRLKEEQVGQLLDIVAAGHADVVQDAALVPEPLNGGGGGHQSSVFYSHSHCSHTSIM